MLVGASVGAEVTGAFVGAGVTGAFVGAGVTGAFVGAGVIGALVGAGVIGASVGAEVSAVPQLSTDQPISLANKTKDHDYLVRNSEKLCTHSKAKSTHLSN